MVANTVMRKYARFVQRPVAQAARSSGGSPEPRAVCNTRVVFAREVTRVPDTEQASRPFYGRSLTPRRSGCSPEPCAVCNTGLMLAREVTRIPNPDRLFFPG